jgi:hypothetical protein
VIPSVGRIVHYRLTAQDAEQVNRRRADTRRHLEDHRALATGVQVHVGNDAREGEVVALVITRAIDPRDQGTVNGKVLLDGNDDLWVTSRQGGIYEDPTPGRWWSPVAGA